MRWIERYEGLDARRQLWIGMLLGLLLLYLSNPLNLTFGYLEAEEGSTYLIYARNVSTLRALFAPHQGYYALVPNVAMLLPARWLPLVTAAWIGEWVGVLFRLSTVWFVFTCESIRTPRARLFLALLLCILPYTSTFPGCIHTQFYLGALTSILLISDPARHRVSRMGILLIGGLTSPASCMFLPFFLVRAWKRRNGSAIAQAAILSVCTAIQLPLVWIAGHFTERPPMKISAPWVYFDTLVNHVLILPFATRVPYRLLATYLAKHPGLPWVLFAVMGAILTYGFYRVVWPAGSAARRILVVGLWGVLLVIATVDPAELIGNVDRYFIGILTCVVVAIVLAMEHYRASANRLAYRAATTMLILVAISGIFDIGRFFRMQQEPLHWSEQVADLQRNPAHQFKNGPWFWWHAFYLPQRPLSLDLPFYTYDSITRRSVVKQLPKTWYEPTNESTTPSSLAYPVDTSKKD